MKKHIVPILTEQYKIVVLIGERKELVKVGAKYLRKTEQEVEKFFGQTMSRGCAIDTFSMGLLLHPLILVDGDFPANQSVGTLAHEASHCMDFITERLGIDDRSGEIQAHGIASVMRHCLKYLNK